MCRSGLSRSQSIMPESTPVLWVVGGFCRVGISRWVRDVLIYLGWFGMRLMMMGPENVLLGGS